MKKYVIAGCGGLGEALLRQILSEDNEVLLISRKIAIDLDNVKLVNMDLAQNCNLDDLSSVLKEYCPDYVINAIGVLHDENHMPEKNIQQLSEEWLVHSVKVNVMPTVRLVKCLSAVMSRQSELKFLSLSARVSSITDNRLGGWYSYRMSKVALNMLIKNVAIEWSRQHPNAGIYAYHPGTVDTALSKPFQSNVDPEHLFPAEQAAEYLLSVLEHLNIQQSGGLFDWQGLPIEC